MSSDLVSETTPHTRPGGAVPDAATVAARQEPAPSADEAERARALARMKRLATSLLCAMTVVFLVSRALEGRHPWVGYIRATAEAAMVGALADWFAVTALFRHPLGIPIPHTAIIPTRKDDIGRGLGDFVQGNFLSGPVLTEKIRSVGVARQVGAWLADAENASRLAANAGDVVRAVTEVLSDDDVSDAIEHMVDARIRSVPAAPMAARLIDILVDDGHYQELFDSVLTGARRLLDLNRTLLRNRLEHESPWWVPDVIDDRVFAKIYNGVQHYLQEIAEDRDHEVRSQIDQRIRELAVKLRESPDLAARGESLKEQLLAHPAVRAWSASLWGDLKQTLIDTSGDPTSELRRRLAEGIVRLGRTIEDDPELQAKIDGWVERTVTYLLDQYREEIAELISGTVARWDANDASRRIELQVGRDLQYIRINGTVVGGLAGLVIFTLSRLLF